MQAMEASRMRWYSLSVRVWAGATVIESPVCTPMGSRFSMEQTTTTLSILSRITSSSNSFQPLDRFLDQDLPDHARVEAATGHILESQRVRDDGAARSPEGE